MEKERLSKENIKTIKDLINYFGIDEKFIEEQRLGREYFNYNTSKDFYYAPNGYNEKAYTIYSSKDIYLQKETMLNTILESSEMQFWFENFIKIKEKIRKKEEKNISVENNKILVSKSDLIILVKGHYEKDEEMFKKGAINIQNAFNENGDYQLEEYVMCLLNPHLAWTTQEEHNE